MGMCLLSCHSFHGDDFELEEKGATDRRPNLECGFLIASLSLKL